VQFPKLFQKWWQYATWAAHWHFKRGDMSIPGRWFEAWRNVHCQSDDIVYEWRDKLPGDMQIPLISLVGNIWSLLKRIRSGDLEMFEEHDILVQSRMTFSRNRGDLLAKANCMILDFLLDATGSSFERLQIHLFIKSVQRTSLDSGIQGAVCGH
jgi:hypothetical protein